MAANAAGRTYQRGKVWWASCYVSGVEVRRRGGSKADAERVLKALRKEREAGRPHVSLGETLSSYRRDLASRAKPKTLSTYDESVKILEGYFGPTYNVLDFTTQGILDFLADRAKTRANISANRPVRNLRVALNHAVELRVIKELPCRLKLLREMKKKPRILTVKQFKKVLGATEHPGARLALVLAYQCGLRHDEIVHLRFRDIVIGEKRSFVAVRGYDGWSPKTHVEREVPLSLWTLDAISSYMREHNNFLDLQGDIPLICWGVHKPHRYRDLYVQVRAGFQRAGIWDPDAKSGLHMCRRTFASHMLADGCDLKTVMELGGWSTIDAVQRYLSSTDELKLNAVDGLDRRLRVK